MEKIINRIKEITGILLFVVIFVLLVIIYFKNNRIDNLKAKLDKKPTIEYVYTHTVDTITDSIPTPYEVIKTKIEYIDTTIYKPLDLTSADSAQIAEAYVKVLDKYSELKKYDTVLKDDSVAYARLTEEVQYNTISNRRFIFESREPTVIIKKIPDKTFSIVGGLTGNFDGISLGGGVVTVKNTVYTINYDPFNKTYRAGVYLPIFNF